MKTVSLEELLEAGCHFGHQVTRQNPKARDYIFEARDNIHIIDLEKTKEGLERAGDFVKKLASQFGTTMIILGAKRQAQPVVRQEVERAQKELGSSPEQGGLYSVTNRWIGGILTNFSEVSKNFKRLKDLTNIPNDPVEKSKYTKKELSLFEKERQKLISFYGGIAEMTKLPNAVFIIDTHLEQLAVHEANVMNVKTVGITDTNADPTLIDHPIPANDDAVGSVQLIVSYIVDAWIEGRKQAGKTEEENVSKETKRVAEEEKKAQAAKGIEQSAKSTKKKVEEEKAPKKAEKQKKTVKGKEQSAKS